MDADRIASADDGRVGHVYHAPVQTVTMTFYAKMQELADELITEFGQKGAITRPLWCQ